MLQDSSSPSGEIPLLRTRLSVQMFIQFAIWGVWLPVLGNHLSKIGVAPDKIGLVYGTGPLALMIAPLLAGQIADRYFATQHYLAFSYFVSGVLFWMIPDATDYNSIWWLSLASMIFFGPTLGLANSLCFHHLKNSERDFPYVRVFGTYGWIAAGWGLAYWLEMDKGHSYGDSFKIAAVLSFINGVYVLTLPHTPPPGKKSGSFPLSRILGMLADPSFAVFILLAFLALIFATYYYNYTGLFMEKGMNIEPANIPRVMSIGQIMEIAVMYILPFALQRLGMKTVIALGIVAWGVRFGIFALGTPKELVIAAQALHGFCFAFAIAAAMIYADRISPPDIKGSMQSFLAFVTYGLGMFLGSLIAAYTMAKNTTETVKIPEAVKDVVPEVAKTATETVKTIHWNTFWMVPAAGCAVALVLFVLGFKAKDKADNVTLGEEAKDAPPGNI